MEKRKVMLVDDEEDFLKIVKINLEKTGKYEVQPVSDATDIISEVKSFNPNIILLDILMPKMDGAYSGPASEKGSAAVCRGALCG